MTNNPNQPREYDAVLGGQAPPPITAAVLGEIKGVKHRFASTLIEARMTAVNEALKYGDAGLDLVIKALQDESAQIQRSAYQLLLNRREPKVKQAIRELKSWYLVERLQQKLKDPRYCTTFSNRKVNKFTPETGITETAGIAYVIENYNFDTLLQDPQASKIEALLFPYIKDLEKHLAVKERLKNIRALFLHFDTYHIENFNTNAIVEAYSNLEIMRIFITNKIEHNHLKHNKLKALIVEGDGLSSEIISQICASELPALNHLELWLPNRSEKNFSVQDLMPIFHRGLFPKLAYLGLCNSEHSDEIAEAIAYSPEIEFLKVLDLSMGTLTDKGAEVLLNCPAVKQLDILNVAENYLSDEMIERLQQLEVQVIANEQKRDTGYRRHCSIPSWIPF